jgi:hypothetical protein
MLAGTDAIHGLGGCLELLPPGYQLRLLFRLRMRFTVWLDVSPPLPFGCGFPGCVPGDAGVGGPLLISGVGGFEALAFGGQLRGEGGGAGRADVVVLDVGVGGLPVGVGFGLSGKSQLPADIGRGGGAGALTLESSRFEFAEVQAADDIGLVADLQGSEDGRAHGFEVGGAAVRLKGGSSVGVGDPGCFPVGGSQPSAAGVFLA